GDCGVAKDRGQSVLPGGDLPGGPREGRPAATGDGTRHDPGGSSRADRAASRGAQRLLQTACVLGREVPVALLRAIWKERGALDPLLRELTRFEFLSKRSGDVDSTYMFTHTLTQEVVYESLSPARRATLHAAAGTALETLYVTRLEEVTDRLAHHY